MAQVIFGDRLWASIGYFAVMPVFLAGPVHSGARRSNAKGRAPEGARPDA